MGPPAHWSAGVAGPGRVWARWWDNNCLLFGYSLARPVLGTELLLVSFLRLVMFCRVSLLQNF